MNTLSPSIAELLREAHSGSDEAAALLYKRCRSPLLAIIRKSLFHPLRKLYDSDDFLLETFAAIFAHHFTEEVLCSPQALWTYLKKIAENKVRDAKRKYLLTRRHDLHREVNFHADDKETTWSREFSPEEAMMLTDLVENRLVHLIEQLSPVHQGIALLTLRGHNGLDIARQLELQPGQVYEMIHWLRQKMVE